MIDKDGMRAQYAATIADWTRPVKLTRYIASTDTSGRAVGTFEIIAAAEPMWIQAISKGDVEVLSKGIAAETTHYGFTEWAGAVIMAMDKIEYTDEQGNLIQFDVVRSSQKDSHRITELKLVARTNPEPA